MMRMFIVVLLILLGISSLSHGDTIQFSPDSKLVGELKRLERGQIYFKTDATGTIPIEIDNVVALTSSQQVQAEMSNGRRYLGELTGHPQPGMVTLRTAQGEQNFELMDIVQLTPIESSFVERIDGEINAGVNFAKDSEILQTNLGLAAQYLTDDYEINLSADAIISRDSQNESSQRSVVHLSTLRRMRGDWEKWSAGLRLNFERSDGLGTDLRSSFGIGVQRDLRHTNSNRLTLAGGLLYSQERVAGPVDDEESMEGLIKVDYELFRYDAPELDVSTSLEVIPNFSNWGRVRSNLDLTLKWELYEDLFFRMSYYRSHDSDPPSSEAAEDDYGVITGLAWEF